MDDLDSIETKAYNYFEFSLVNWVRINDRMQLPVIVYYYQLVFERSLAASSCNGYLMTASNSH